VKKKIKKKNKKKSTSMSLFVGRLSSDTRPRDLEELFYKFGKITRCDVKRGGFGFVEFDDKRDAEDAIRELDGATLLGRHIAVEWAKGPRRGSDSSSGRDKNGDACFKCGDTGHWARDCTNSRRTEGGASRRRSRSRSKSPRRRRSSRERDRSPRRRSRSPPRRDRERERSPKRDRTSPKRKDRSASPKSPRRASHSPAKSPRDSPRSPKKDSPRDDEKDDDKSPQRDA